VCLDFQGPDCLNQEKVFRLVEALRRRKKLEPLVVYFGRETYWRMASTVLLPHTS